MDFYWETLVIAARRCDDVTYEEWCDLYFTRSNPSKEQIQKSTETAKTILIRNKTIGPDITVAMAVRDVV